MSIGQSSFSVRNQPWFGGPPFSDTPPKMPMGWVRHVQDLGIIPSAWLPVAFFWHKWLRLWLELRNDPKWSIRNQSILFALNYEKKNWFLYWTTNLFGSRGNLWHLLGSKPRSRFHRFSVGFKWLLWLSYLWKKLCNPSIFLIDPNKQWKPFKKKWQAARVFFTSNPKSFWT